MDKEIGQNIILETNTKTVYRETETKRLVLKLLEERLNYSIEQKNKNKDIESYWYGVEAEIKELIKIIQKDEF